MKTKLFLFICTLASMFLITSCSKSDDNETISVQESPLTKIGITNPVKSCKAYIGDELNYSYSYIYANNFLQSCSLSDLYSSMTFNYSNLSINGKMDTFSYTFSNIILNNQGFISSMSMSAQSDDIDPFNMTFEYNDDGYLTKCTIDSPILLRNITYTYNDDNDLCKLKAVDYYMRSGKEIENDYLDFTCSYNDNLTLNTGIYLNGLYALPIIGACDWNFMYSGLFGKPSKHIPDEITGILGDGDGDDTDYDYDDVRFQYVCTKNSKGQITNIKSTSQSTSQADEYNFPSSYTYEY